MAIALLLVLVPIASATGGGEAWIRIECNVNEASVSLNGEYKGVISGGSLTVPVFTTGTPYITITVSRTGIPRTWVPCQCRLKGRQLPIMPR